MRLVITIDGPSGAGKSTVSRRLAGMLGFDYVDSGALYRVVALEVKRQGIDENNDAALQHLCDNLEITFRTEDGMQRIMNHGNDVTDSLRTPEISMLASRISARKITRDCLTALQRKLGEEGTIVVEGRDAGTVVFPDAAVKFFLNASAEERGKRRFRELQEKGVPVTLEEVMQDIIDRDYNDSTREHAPLAPAEDAVFIDSTGMSIDEVLETMAGVITSKTVRGYH